MMAVSYLIDTMQRLAFATLNDRVTGAEIGQTIAAIYTDADWQPGFNIVWDGSLISELMMEREDLPNLSEVQRSFGGRAGDGRDVIITNRLIDEMMANMYVAFVRHLRPTFLATSREEAMAVLRHHDAKRQRTPPVADR